ncbi:hypothetical protein SEUCBS140593_002070 [Sporothrix eucalyptigena]|uniref:Uncharacterized protein n=1 Tax=Sporothrix eucalyptigena TaxID=1812306 RepID=A0ABP0B3H0_9PEZI
MYLPRVLLLLGSAFLPRAWSQVTYTYPTDDCTTEGPILGNSVFCCSGACLDGTRIGEPGQCENWLNLCGDVDSPPSCAGNQVLSYGDPATVNSGDGCCGACCCECLFQQNIWSWNCCDCPAGYVAVDGGSCSGTASPPCVGCEGPDQVLTGDSTSGYQSKDLSNLTSALGLASTYFGALCKVTTFNSGVLNIIGAVYSAANAAVSPSPGYLGSDFSAFSTVLATISAFLITAFVPEETAGAGLAAAILEGVQGLCNANTAFNWGSTVVGQLESEYLSKHCPSSDTGDKITKRDSPLDLSGRDVTDIAWSMSPRGAVWNPCAELVSLFPNSSEIPTIVEGACGAIQPYNPSDIADAGLANATRIQQTICASDNLTAVVDFANQENPHKEGP